MIKTTTNTIEFLDSGIIHCKMKSRSGFKEVYVIEQANSISHVVLGNKKPLLIDLTRMSKASIEEVRSLMSKETLEISSAIGIVLNSGYRKTILNTIWKNSSLKMGCPIKVFLSIEDAEKWLLGSSNI